MGDLQQMWAQIRHLHNRLDVFADVLEETNPRAAASLRTRDPGRSLPQARVDWLEEPTTDPYRDAVMKSLRENPDAHVVGPDPGLDKTDWAHPERHGRGG